MRTITPVLRHPGNAVSILGPDKHQTHRCRLALTQYQLMHSSQRTWQNKLLLWDRVFEKSSKS